MALVSTFVSASLVSSITSLGHHINQHGAVQFESFPSPLQKGLQEFVGMVTFCHHLALAVVRIMQPLFKVLANNPKDLGRGSYNRVRKLYGGAGKANDAGTPRNTPPKAFTVDACDTVVGEVLEQLIDGNWGPLTFFS